MAGTYRSGIWLVVTALTVHACALKDPPDTVTLQKEALPANLAVPAAWIADPTGSGTEPVAPWVTTFGDPQLPPLVAEAIANNIDLRLSAARVERAAAEARLAGAQAWPLLAGRVELADNSKGRLEEGVATGAVVGASWELDLWGRVRAGRAAARAQFASAEADLAFSQQSIAAATARGWFLATEAALQARLAEEAVRLFTDVLGLVEQRRNQGFANDHDVALARLQVSLIREAERRRQAGYEQAERSVETVLGRYPAAEIAGAQELPGLPPPIPTGLPSALLERRPDIIAAERRVSAAFFNREEAKAARLPRIALTGAIGTGSADIAGEEDVDNPIWAFGIRLLSPIFLGGALNARVAIRTAEQNEASANYARVGTRAFAEVENALAQEKYLRDQERFLAAAEGDAAETVRLARIRFDVGQTTLADLLLQQAQLVETRAQLARIRGQLLVNRVDLHVALGGGF
jgi:outer membrane protein, multidrug efflux system